jgi:hypothetical protein
MDRTYWLQQLPKADPWQVKPNPLPHRAFFETFSVGEDAGGNAVLVDVVKEEDTEGIKGDELQVPHPFWHPVPQ